MVLGGDAPLRRLSTCRQRAEQPPMAFGNWPKVMLITLLLMQNWAEEL